MIMYCRSTVCPAIAVPMIAVPAYAQQGTVRIIQTNAAGDNVHIIDPETNEVVEIIHGIPKAHGVTSAPDGSTLYFSNEIDRTLDIVVTPDLQWRWKDEDQFQRIQDLGWVTREEAAVIRAEGERVIEKIEKRCPPFSEPWPEWRPNPNWRSGSRRR